jgi:D-3-phosphoglycerate dehydrogenase / 2-oxoglutarate reductase
MTRGRVLVTPRSLTRAAAAAGQPSGPAPDPQQSAAVRIPPDLEPLTGAGYELVFAPSGELPDEATLLRLLPGCVGWLAGVEPITRRVLEAAPDLRVISRNGAGTDTIDLDAAADLGVRVERAAGANARSVAELTIALVLAGLRHLPAQAAALAAGEWHRPQGREAQGLRLGVVGCGAVGGEVATLGGALGMRVTGYDPYPQAGFAPTPGFRYVGLAELLAGSDVITLHAPPPQGGAPLLGAAQLAAVPRGCLLVNAARASLVDEAAVLAALEDGRLSCYATDVHHREPPGRTPLLAHPRVIATPHTGGYTREAVARATAAAVTNLLDALAQPEGKEPKPARKEQPEGKEPRG